ncbi:MAG: alpha/beta hydrolase [Amaricoccus sp.]
MSLRLSALNQLLRWVERPYMEQETDVVRARARLDRNAQMLPIRRGTRFQRTGLGGVPVIRIAGQDDGDGPVLLWLHGGAYCIGSPDSHLRLVAELAARIGASAVLPAYRLAPEHPFPAAPDDALAAYEALLAEEPGPIVLGGDSAGGGLAFALLHRILAQGLPTPCCVVAFSPWTDLTLSGESLVTLEAQDPLLPASRLAEVRDLYLTGQDAADPLASPRFGRFTGAPPALIQAGANEILRDDAVAMAARLEADAVPVELDLWPDVPHVWQFYSGLLPEADEALADAAAFIQARLPV